MAAAERGMMPARQAPRPQMPCEASEKLRARAQENQCGGALDREIASVSQPVCLQILEEFGDGFHGGPLLDRPAFPRFAGADHGICATPRAGGGLKGPAPGFPPTREGGGWQARA